MLRFSLFRARGTRGKSLEDTNEGGRMGAEEKQETGGDPIYLFELERKRNVK